MYIVKVKELKAWSDPEGSRKLSFPDFMTTAQVGSKIFSLTHRPHLPQGKGYDNEKFQWYHLESN